MKPTTEQTMQWAQEAGWMKVLWKDQYADGMDCIKKLATLAYAAGAESMQERCLRVCEAEVEFNTAHPPINASVAAYRCVKAIRALGDDYE